MSNENKAIRAERIEKLKVSMVGLTLNGLYYEDIVSWCRVQFEVTRKTARSYVDAVLLTDVWKKKKIKVYQ